MKRNELIELIKRSKRNLIVMIGPPMSGKSTFISSISEHIDKVISTDNLVESMNPHLTYNESYKMVDWKKIRIRIRHQINETLDSDLNVVIDMTNMNKKSRKQQIKKYSSFTKIAVITNVTDKSILLERNKIRDQEQGKFIPEKVLDSMLSKYQAPTKEEGFDQIVKL